MFVFSYVCILLQLTIGLHTKSVPTTITNDASWKEEGRFLQMVEKRCQGPKGELGVCMFNYQCQKHGGVVVAPCVDGFLFGACCHVPQEHFENSQENATEVPPAFIDSSSPEAKSSETILASDEEAVPLGMKEDGLKLHMAAAVSYNQFPSEQKGQLLNRSAVRNADGIARLPAVSSATSTTTAPPKSLADTVFSPSPRNNTKVISNLPVIDQSDNLLQQTLQALLLAHTSETGTTETKPSTVSPNESSSSSSLHYNSPLKESATTKPPKPATRKPGRRKPTRKTTTSTTTTTTTTTTPLPTTTAIVTTTTTPTTTNSQSTTTTNTPETTTTTSTTTTPGTTTTATTTTSAARIVSSSTTRKPPAVQTEDYFGVLQYLVSNPPNWVVDEVQNRSTFTTWYPLPIPEMMVTPPAQAKNGVSTSTTSTVVGLYGSEQSSTTKKPKRNKTRRPGSKKKTATTTTSTTTTTAATTISTTTASSTSTTPTTTTTTVATTTTTTTTPTTTTASTTTTTTTRKPRPAFDYKRDCGVRPMVSEARIVGGKRSDFGRWPWQVLIRETTWFGIFSKNKCGGVLISERHVLTAAHCQPGFLGSLVVVLGEFDLGQSEPVQPIEKNVRRVIIHKDYVERTFENDLAILELDSPITLSPSIVPICVPFATDGDYRNNSAYVTGWGKLQHGGSTPGVLHEVDVPIISNAECHDMFKKAGHEKKILDSFVCAGYPEGKKDSCEGDSGGPLMVEREDGRWVLIGTVSHGIRCAYPNMPGVYMRITHYRSWIERVTGIGGVNFGKR